MSKFTTEVRFICEMNSGYDVETMNTHSVDDIIDKSRSKIFNFSYPIFDVSYKPILEHKILKHYYFREICCETVELWRTFLNARLNDIMPKYNKLYEFQRDYANKLFNNIDVTSNGIRTDALKEVIDALRTDNLRQIDNGHKFNTYHEDRKHKDEFTNAYSDTPQGSVTFNETKNGDVWLTDFRKTNDVSTDIIDGTNNDTEIYNDRKNTGTQNNHVTKDNTGTQNNDVHEFGYRGGKTYMELINELSEKFLNIDLMIIEDLRTLFFLLW